MDDKVTGTVTSHGQVFGMIEDGIQRALVLWRYQRDVDRQCDFALKAFDELNNSVQLYMGLFGRLPQEHTYDAGIVVESDEYYMKMFQYLKEEQEARPLILEHEITIWFCLQNILVSVANLSKLLWPTGRNPSEFSRAIRSELRSSLRVTEDSPLKSRRFRNDFEHFDERLEEWANSSANNMFIDSVIASEVTDLLDPEIFNPRSVFRHYDPRGQLLTFHGNAYHLQPVLTAVKRLSEDAEAKTSQNPLHGLDLSDL